VLTFVTSRQDNPKCSRGDEMLELANCFE